MTDGEWVVFDKRRLPTVRDPLVTKQSDNNFSYNLAAHQMLGEPEALELLYNEKRKEIGFRAADLSQPHVYPVRRQRNSSNFQFSGVAFASAFGIPKGETLRFKAEKRGDDMLVIDLKNPRGNVGRPRRNPKPERTNEKA
jgi:hypothetical protein